MAVTEHSTNQMVLYPLRFEPIYQYRLWGGRRLAGLLTAPLPTDGPIGEAWILSDRDDHPSRIANGPLQGQIIGHLMEQSQEQLMGKLAGRFQRFPLLLKFLDAHEMLSVQVHPGYAHADSPPAEGTAKTEAWVVLEAGKESHIYAGLRPGTTADILRQAVTNGTLADQLVSITPKPGDGVFIPAGTVHSLGGDVVVFEVQQNSDTTFRLYDWGHVDAKTGQPRELEVDQALACIDFVDGAAGLVAARSGGRDAGGARETLSLRSVLVVAPARRIAVYGWSRGCAARTGMHRAARDRSNTSGETYAVRKGEVWLLPAVVGACTFRPSSEVNLLEIAIPEDSAGGQKRVGSQVESSL